MVSGSVAQTQTPGTISNALAILPGLHLPALKVLVFRFCVRAAHPLLMPVMAGGISSFPGPPTENVNQNSFF